MLWVPFKQAVAASVCTRRSAGLAAHLAPCPLEHARLALAAPHWLVNPLQDVYAFALYVDQAAARSKLGGKFRGQAADAVAKDQQLFDGEGSCRVLNLQTSQWGRAHGAYNALSGDPQHLRHCACLAVKLWMLYCLIMFLGVCPRHVQSWWAARGWRRCCASSSPAVSGAVAS